MLELLVEPLTELLRTESSAQEEIPSNPNPRLVVLDGLDECNDQETQCDLLRIIASAISRLPYPFRFLTTSRPESHIALALQRDLTNADAENDIRNFVEAQFAEIRRDHPLGDHLPAQWPPPGSVSAIVEQSSGHFIYASTVIRFIRSPRHRLDDRLQVILGLKQPFKRDRPYAVLDSLYGLIFHERHDPD